MNKFKLFAIVLIAVMMLFAFCNTIKATEMQPRTAEEGENAENLENPNDGIMPINLDEEDEYNRDQEAVPQDIEMHKGDLYIASTDITYVMDQIVDGNVFIFGNNVKITGQVNGSIFVAAKSVEVDKEAYIVSHLFAAAETVTINGYVTDVYSASRILTFGEDALLVRDIKSAAEMISLSGTIGRDVNLSAKTIEIPETEKALEIYGNLDYYSKEKISNIDKATIHGEVIYQEYTEDKEEIADVIVDYALSAIGTVVFDIVLYMCLIFFAPKFLEKAKDYVSTRGILSLAFGIAFIVLGVIISFLLMLTNIGTALGVLLALMYAGVLMLNAFIIAIVANEFIASKLSFKEDKFKKGLLLIPVSLVLWIVIQIPFIGSWISAAVCLCGVGIIILYQFDRRKELNK